MKVSDVIKLMITINGGNEMRKYDSNMKLIEMKCNKCGKNIVVENGMAKEGVYNSEYNWGYFSEKDGEKHVFDLCENCYEEMIKEFNIKVEIKENVELL